MQKDKEVGKGGESEWETKQVAHRESEERGGLNEPS